MVIAHNYTRFSSKKQEAGDTTRRQDEGGDTFIRRMKWTHGTLNLRDEGVSGYTGENRKTGDLGRFLEAIKNKIVKPGEFLVIENWDRFSREEMVEAFPTFCSIIKAGVGVATWEDHELYTLESLSENEHQYHIIQGAMMRAHAESRRKSKLIGKAKRAIIEAAKANKTAFEGRHPFWVKVVDGKFQTIPEGKEMFLKAVDLAIGGMGVGSIIKRLNSRHSIHVANATLRRLFNNRQSLGEYQPTKPDGKGNYVADGQPVQAFYPIILDEKKWYRLQGALGGRKKTRGRTGKYVGNLFTGMLKHGPDNEPIWITYSDGEHKRMVIGSTLRVS
jgi:DNA invertase Pin-like site-specific DNA recombinase